MYKLFMKIENLPYLFIVNQLLAEFTQILRSFYDLLIILIRSKSSLIDVSGYAHAGLNHKPSVDIAN